ncbi:hypothetical protein [Microbacterium album]|uniref:Uncharacterized protein n=1 Tax=Microbacterium album TaxID=2053191 RepID=A0A917MMQ7_9MICO|nr:hypothetical protein [Microbacterium album]GGH36489.1 hypothetical protein GCM10010921_05680 [Microbacterium album]
MTDPSLQLFLPDRFDVLRDREELDAIVMPVESALSMIDDQFNDLVNSGFGAMVILRGSSGAGKTTFLDTVSMFRPDVQSVRVPYGESVNDALEGLQASDDYRLIVIEGREALGRVAMSEIEEGLHAINSFLRSPAGRSSLIVWPTNTDDLAEKLSSIAEEIGASALIGTDEIVYQFDGPPRTEWVTIAEQTTAALNAGATLSAYGISTEEANDLVSVATSLGDYLKRVRKRGNANTNKVSVLDAAERCRVWTVVIAADSDSEGDVAALTRGGLSQVDIDRLFTATGANALSEMKKQPERYGLLGMVLDARIIHVDQLTALAVARSFGDAKLKEQMVARGMDTKSDAKAIERITTGQLGLLMRGQALGTRKRGPKEGSNTKAAMKNLVDIARSHDSLPNRAFGEALRAAGIIDEFVVEKPLVGNGTKRRADLYVERGGIGFHLEFMWRDAVGRADIANYVVGKLANYGKVTGYLT